VDKEANYIKEYIHNLIKVKWIVCSKKGVHICLTSDNEYGTFIWFRRFMLNMLCSTELDLTTHLIGNKFEFFYFCKSGIHF
jgi:hypothetical protein